MNRNNFFQFFHEYFYVSDPITLRGWHLRGLSYPENNGGIRTDGRSGNGVAAEKAMALDTVAAVCYCRFMNDTRANQWIPVSERLPEHGRFYVVVLQSGQRSVAYRSPFRWEDETRDRVLDADCVTHWMDLPEPPEPPKPADPFEAWWKSYPACETQSEAARAAWNAAKDHYAKPLPDFETWAKAHCADGPYLFIRNKTCLVHRASAQDIWNAAQGKPEA